jgi:murein DD-endopeptidase MepM/ murein hydrolase activator NlpD
MHEGCRQVRRSAATIGLAISMGAASLLLLNQNEPAVAAESVTAQSTVTSLPADDTANRDLPKSEAANKPSSLTFVKLTKWKEAPSSYGGVSSTAPTVEHEVEEGESLWQLSQEYRIAPEVIAASNKISPQANLFIGQTLKIPTLEKSENSTNSGEPVKIIASRSSDVVEPEPVNRSLSKLRESRQRLQESLAQLNFEESAQVSSPASSEILSLESLTLEKNSTILPQVTALSSNTEKADLPATNTPSGSEEKEVLLTSEIETARETQAFDRPIPLAISVPDSEEASSQTLSRPQLPTLEMNLPEAESESSVAERVYRVKRGDTLNKIADRYGITVSELIRANKIRNPNVIKVSQQLTIPNREVAKPRTENSPIVADISVTANRSNPSIPVVTASLSPVAIATAQVETPVASDPLTNPHADKLIADINRLQQDYPKQSRPISVESNRPTAPSSETLNPEWTGDRQPNTNPSTIQIQGASQPRVPGPRFVRSSGSSNYQNQTTQNQTRLVGAAPMDAQQYNNVMRLPVGETVGPDLPPLSVPDDYLPDTPMKFTGYIWPAKGVLTSGYGWRWGRMHKGVDIAAPIGTPIAAAAAGEVVSAGWNSGGYGNLVKIKHPDGSVTLYAHNSRILVRSGQMVEQGDLIAEMGSTGYSTGPHLHFEIHPSGQGAVNPMAFLPRQRS